MKKLPPTDHFRFAENFLCFGCGGLYVELLVFTDDFADVADELLEIGLFAGNDGGVGGYARNGIIFTHTADVIEFCGVDQV